MGRKLSWFSRNRDFTMVILLTIIALIVRLISLRYYPFIGVDGGVDGVGYVTSGKNLFSGLGYSFHDSPQLVNPPLYPVLIGISWLFTHNLEFSGQIVSVIAGSLLIIPVFYLTKKMFGRKAAFFSAIFVVICPPLIFGSTEVRVASLYTLLVWAAMAVGWKALQSKYLIWSAFTGLMLALCYLTRAEAIMLPPIFLLLYLLSFKLRTGSHLSIAKSVVFKGIILIAVFALISSPFLVFLYRHTGTWTFSGRSAHVFPGYYGNWERANF